MRRIALFGLVFLAATAAVAAASTDGLPNIGKPSMKAQPVYKGFYDHHIDTYLIIDVSVLIGQDDQIDALEKKGKLTEKDAHIVLNAPILHVGKGG